MDDIRPDYLKWNDNVVRVIATVIKRHNNMLETNEGWVDINYCLYTHPIKPGDQVLARANYLKTYD
jgi:hypothetical protein